MECNTKIVVDGITYNVQVTELSADGQFLYKFAERTEDGVLQSEGIGFFYNMNIDIKADNNPEFIELWRVLATLQADGTFNHDVEVYTPVGTFTQKMYANALQIPIVRFDDDLDPNHWWGEMSINFIAVEKAE